MSRPSIFITGAAAGIGQAAARLFAARGWFVGLYDLDAEGVAALACELGDGRAMAGRLDVTRGEDWEAALAGFHQRAGRLDVLLNNAGILVSGPFETIPLARQQAVVEVNVKGVLAGCHAAFPYLRRQAGARVINMASASALYGQPSLATYSATKFAVRGLTEALDLEWQAHGIRVMDIMPLFVQTGMVVGMNAKSIASLGVTLTPEDVARAIWRAATGRRVRVHWPVGMQTRLFYSLVGLAPDWVTRGLTRRIATSH